MRTKAVKRTKADVVTKLVCLVLALVLFVSATMPPAVGAYDYPLPDEYYVGDDECADDDAYIAQEEPEVDIPKDDELGIEDGFDYNWFYNLPPEEGDPVSFWDLPILSEEEWQEFNRIQPFSTDAPTVFVNVGDVTSTSVRLGANIIFTGGVGITIVQRSFLIRRADGVGGTRRYDAETNAGNVFSRTITGLDSATEYIVQSVVRNSNGIEGVSFESRFTTLPGVGNQPIVPDAPRSLVATAGEAGAGLEWLTSFDGGSPIIRHEVSINNGGWVNVNIAAGFSELIELYNAEIAPTNAMVSFLPNLQVGLLHSFRVRAVNAVGPSEPSNTAWATPFAPPPPRLELLRTEDWEVAAAGGTITVGVSSNRSWTVNTPAWISVTSSSGAGEGTFTVTAAPNPLAVPRQGTITVTTYRQGAPSSEILTVSFNVRQEVGAILSFDVNGGVGTIPPIGVAPGMAIGNRLPTPTRLGFTFAGWYTAARGPVGGHIVRATAEAIVHGDVTLYARWTIWHSVPAFDQNNNEVEILAFWPGEINVHSRVQGEVHLASFPFNTLVNESRAAWSNALGISIGSAATVAGAQIRAIGATRAWLDYRTQGAFPSSAAGAVPMSWGPDPVGSFMADGINRNVYHLNGPLYMYVVEMSTDPELAIIGIPASNDRNRLLMVTLHEMGHTLGYGSHSPNSRYIMFETAHTSTVLQPREIFHLRQVYDWFRVGDN